jgi:hypothetical protein
MTSLRADVDRLKAEVRALESTLWRNDPARGQAMLRIVNDPENFDDEVIQTWPAESWDGISTIEVTSGARRDAGPRKEPQGGLFVNDASGT